MKIEEQVCSLELARKLKELEVKQNSLFVWVKDSETKKYKLASFISPWYNAVSNYYCGGFDDKDHPMFAAFTVAELGEILPARLEYDRTEHPVYRLAMEKQDTQWNIVYVCADCDGRNFDPMTDDLEVNARAKMLIHLIENKLLT